MVETVARPRSAGHGTRERILAIGFLLPSLLIFGVFIVYPLGRTFYLSTYTENIIGEPTEFVGVDNFTAIFTSSEFATVLTTTFLFTLLTVLPAVVGGLFVVLLLEQHIRGIRFFRTGFALPFGFSVATASVIFGIIYNPSVGVANGILFQLGVDRVPWLTDAPYALISVSLATVWMNLGYNVLVLSAGIGSIPTEVNEAARLDGASGFRLARSITVPLLSPQLFFLVVISTIHALQSFGQINILTKGGPRHTTTTLVYSIYENAFAYGNTHFGLASAQAIVLLVIMLACAAVQFGLLERRVHYR